MYQVLIAGLGLGLLSSLHCIGMCGPIALSLPVHRFFGWERFTRIFSYHAGRIITYSTLGFLFGWFGRGLHVAGLQQWVSIVSGILILLFLVQEYIFRATVFPLFMQRFRSFTQVAMGRLLKGKTPQDLLLMGMINGLLPCAMIYIAVAGSLNGGTVFLSTSFMFMYGLGTVPAMLMLNVAGGFIQTDLRFYIRKATPFLIACIAVFLILRGLNLGIPYISPVLPSATNAVQCHGF